jgi:hypothetical protein
VVAKPKNGGPKAVTQQSAGIQGKNISCMMQFSFLAYLLSYFSHDENLFILCDVNPNYFFVTGTLQYGTHLCSRFLYVMENKVISLHSYPTVFTGLLNIASD